MELKTHTHPHSVIVTLHPNVKKKTFLGHVTETSFFFFKNKILKKSKDDS